MSDGGTVRPFHLEGARDLAPEEEGQGYVWGSTRSPSWTRLRFSLLSPPGVAARPPCPRHWLCLAGTVRGR